MMKRTILQRSVAAVLIAVLFFASAPIILVGAQEAETPVTDAELMMTTMSQEEPGNTGTGRPADREARIKQYKEQATEKMTQAQENRLANRCKNAQSKIASLSANVATVVSNRQSVYTGVGERLGRLSKSLMAANVDTTELDAAVLELQSMNETFGVTAENYQLALSDLAEMDCTADPEAFMAALETARKDRPELFKQSQAMRTYIQETIRPLLTSIRQSLEGGEAGDQSTEQTDNQAVQPVESTEE